MCFLLACFYPQLACRLESQSLSCVLQALLGALLRMPCFGQAGAGEIERGGKKQKKKSRKQRYKENLVCRIPSLSIMCAAASACKLLYTD